MTPASGPGPAGEQLSADQLRTINRLTTVARLVSGLAHELNNSLQVIGGLVELLADRTDLPPDAAARIARIGTQADRASESIRNLLPYARESDRSSGPVDLAGTVERALALRHYALGRAGISVGVEKRAGSRFVVHGDERLLLQLVLNLLVNAEEALADSPERALRLTLDSLDGIIRLAVADSGPGVAPESRERIFAPFFSTRGDRAAGLGLTVSAAIAALHRGSLALEGEGPGARFVLQLPAAGP